MLPVSVLAGFGYATYVNIRHVTDRQRVQRSKIDEQLTRAVILQCFTFILSQVCSSSVSFRKKCSPLDLRRCRSLFGIFTWPSQRMNRDHRLESALKPYLLNSLASASISIMYQHSISVSSHRNMSDAWHDSISDACSVDVVRFIPLMGLHKTSAWLESPKGGHTHYHEPFLVLTCSENK